jgi:hypothetical protein
MSERRIVLPALLALVLGAAVVAPAPLAAQGKPDCTVVLRKLHRSASRGHEPDATKIASMLGVQPSWVERCAESYGRRVKKHDPKPGEIEGQFSARVEEEFLDELAREEKETIGDTYFSVIENDVADRRQLRKFRDADSINEWEPMETHEWSPNLGREWRPFLHDNDLGDGPSRASGGAQ